MVKKITSASSLFERYRKFQEEWEYIKWKNEQKSWIEKNPDYYADFIKNNSTDVATLND